MPQPRFFLPPPFAESLCCAWSGGGGERGGERGSLIVIVIVIVVFLSFDFRLVGSSYPAFFCVFADKPPRGASFTRGVLSAALLIVKKKQKTNQINTQYRHRHGLGVEREKKLDVPWLF